MTLVIQHSTQSSEHSGKQSTCWKHSTFSTELLKQGRSSAQCKQRLQKAASAMSCQQKPK